MTMTKLLFAVAVCLLLVDTGAVAQSKTSGVGTWKLDASQSDFGSDPAPKDIAITVLKDTPEVLSWRVHVLDAKGKDISYSWQGPEDGSMHPVMQDGKSIGNQSAKKQADGALLRHGEDPDGSSFDALSKISDDGKTMTEEATSKSKDGAQNKGKTVYHRR